MSNSTVIMPDGTVRPLDSLDAQERAEMFERWGKRVSRVIQDYLNQHPEEFDRTIQAFRDAGIEVHVEPIVEESDRIAAKPADIPQDQHCA